MRFKRRWVIKGVIDTRLDREHDPPSAPSGQSRIVVILPDLSRVTTLSPIRRVFIPPGSPELICFNALREWEARTYMLFRVRYIDIDTIERERDERQRGHQRHQAIAIKRDTRTSPRSIRFVFFILRNLSLSVRFPFSDFFRATAPIEHNIEVK